MPWLKSDVLLRLRDGVGGPMLGVGPFPNYFANISEEAIRGDRHIRIVPDLAAPKGDHRPILAVEMEAKVKKLRDERKAEMQKRIAAKVEAKVAAKKAEAEKVADAKAAERVARTADKPAPKAPKDAKAKD